LPGHFFERTFWFFTGNFFQRNYYYVLYIPHLFFVGDSSQDDLN
jgi:hypothetical protein